VLVKPETLIMSTEEAARIQKLLALREQRLKLEQQAPPTPLTQQEQQRQEQQPRCCNGWGTLCLCTKGEAYTQGGFHWPAAAAAAAHPHPHQQQWGHYPHHHHHEQHQCPHPQQYGGYAKGSGVGDSMPSSYNGMARAF
jgi:hypothetical protein